MKRLIITVTVTILLLLAALGCGRDRTPESTGLRGRVTLSGAWALYPMAQKWAEEFRRQHPDVTFDISGGGAGKGMTDALAGAVTLGMVSRSVKAEEVAQGAFGIAVTKDAVVPTINANNPFLETILKTGITRDALAGLFLAGTITEWNQLYPSVGGHHPVNLFTRADACGAGQVWAEFLGGKEKKQEALRGTGVNNDPGVAEAVKQDPHSIGYNNINFAYDNATRRPVAGLRVIPLDLDGNGVLDPAEQVYDTLDTLVAAINAGTYPSPPARDLYLVSKGKPADPVVLAFLNWVLTDGQQYVPEAGYVTLTAEKLAAEQAKLR